MALRDGLDPKETVVAEIGVSKRAILVEWLAIPTVFLVFFLTVCLPVIMKTLAVDTAKAAFAQAIGVEEVTFSDVTANFWQALIPAVPHGVAVLLQVMLWLVFFSWLGFTLVRTYLHFGYEILLTDTRVRAKARGENFDREWSEMKNVFVEQSLWGKLLHYGNVTLQGARGSVTVKHIVEPETVRAKFRTYTNTF